MILDTMNVLLAMAPPPSGEGGQGGAPFYVQMVPFILMIVVFYFILIRPQQKKAKEHELLLKSLRPNDKIVTASGIVATVITVKEKTVSIRSADTKLEILKSAVSDITERGDSKES